MHRRVFSREGSQSGQAPQLFDYWNYSSLAQIHPLAAFELEITVDNSFFVYQVALCVESIESSLSG